jgi:hypothetical protein
MVTACFWFGIQSSMAETIDEPVQRRIKIVSDPAGALICKKDGRNYECRDKTPANILLEFHSEISKVKLLLKKTGFVNQTQEVNAHEREFSVHLKKRRILADPGKITDNDLKQLQARVNPLLEKLIYDSNSFFAGVFIDFVGDICLIRLKGEEYLEVGVLLTEPYIGKLKPLFRMDSPNARRQKIVSTILNDIAVDIEYEIVKALQQIEQIKGIALTLYYPRDAAVLVDDTIYFEMSTSYETRTERIYVYWEQPTTVTTVDDITKNYFVLFKTPFSNIKHLNDKNKIKKNIILTSEILTNEGISGRVEKIVLEPR